MTEDMIKANTSFTSEGKLDSVTTDTTESINDNITSTPSGNVPSNYFRCDREPAL